MDPRRWRPFLLLAISILCLYGHSDAQVPTITGITPASGPAGSGVAISGAGFGAAQGSSTIFLNGASAVVTSWSDTAISAVVPSGVASGPFSVTVNGQTAISPTFTITAFPSGWSDGDIGAASPAGNASYVGGVFTVKSAGPGLFPPQRMEFILFMSPCQVMGLSWRVW